MQQDKQGIQVGNSFIARAIWRWWRLLTSFLPCGASRQKRRLGNVASELSSEVPAPKRNKTEHVYTVLYQFRTSDYNGVVAGWPYLLLSWVVVRSHTPSKPRSHWRELVPLPQTPQNKHKSSSSNVLYPRSQYLIFYNPKDISEVVTKEM